MKHGEVLEGFFARVSLEKKKEDEKRSEWCFQSVNRNFLMFVMLNNKWFVDLSLDIRVTNL
jgi:hypothetical protein